MNKYGMVSVMIMFGLALQMCAQTKDNIIHDTTKALQQNVEDVAVVIITNAAQKVITTTQSAVLASSTKTNTPTNSVKENSPKASSLSESTKNEVSGWGAQIGLMMKGMVDSVTDGVTVTTDQIVKLSDTKVGKICTFIIVYKVIGKELIETCRGAIRATTSLVLLTILSIIVFKFYTYMFWPTRRVIESEGKKKTYEYVASWSDRLDDRNGSGCSFFVCLISTAVFVGCFALLFGNL